MMFSRRLILLILALALAGCGSPDAPTAYPAPTSDSYPGQQAQVGDPYPAPTVQPTLTPIPTAAMPTEPAADFGFIFAYGCINLDVVDTFKHTYTKNTLDKPFASTALTLSPDEMRTIYQGMVAINLFGYPAEYKTGVGSMPGESYRFTVRNNGQTTTIDWIDVNISTMEAQRLDDLAKMIIALVETHPEVKQLPERTALCY